MDDPGHSQHQRRGILPRSNPIETRLHCARISNSDFDWKALLKNLGDGRTIVGCGVAAIKFRLLPGVMDHNYERIDSGEGHVFEIVRRIKDRRWPPLLLAPRRRPPVPQSLY